jgi:Ribbon-helix-helix protein
MPTENRTARLTILIDPRKKAVFEQLCLDADTTPSQVVRSLIRDYIERVSGRPWHAEDEVSPRGASEAQGARRVRGR